MKKGSRNGASLCEGSHKGGLEGGLLYWETKNMLSKTRKRTSASVGSPLWGNMDGRFFLLDFLLQEFL